MGCELTESSLPPGIVGFQPTVLSFGKDDPAIRLIASRAPSTLSSQAYEANLRAEWALF